MTVNYRKDRILVPASELQPGAVDRLNKVLEEAGLGRPLRQPEDSVPAVSASALAALPVTGADPMAIRDVVRARAQGEGAGLPTVALDIPYSAGTVDKGTFFFAAAGKKSGHGTAAWLPAPADQMHGKQPWPQSTSHQVIALLDTGVQQHNWLPAGQPPFFVNATEYGWPEPELPHPPKPPEEPPLGTHWGHATFLAGLIRMTAPDAQVISMRVMNDAGHVSDDHLIHALEWLAENQDTIRTDVVLMAFGRHRDEPDDHGLDRVRQAISRLTTQPLVKIVASAGNDGSAQPVYPAAFAVEPSLSASVVSVGALSSPTQWAPFSDYGPWVREARRGTSIISVLPAVNASAGEQQVTDQAFDPLDMNVTRDGFAWWSGTSFAAAIYAGQLASHLPGSQGLPEPNARP